MPHDDQPVDQADEPASLGRAAASREEGLPVRRRDGGIEAEGRAPRARAAAARRCSSRSPRRGGARAPATSEGTGAWALSERVALTTERHHEEREQRQVDAWR